MSSLAFRVQRLRRPLCPAFLLGIGMLACGAPVDQRRPRAASNPSMVPPLLVVDTTLTATRCVTPSSCAAVTLTLPRLTVRAGFTPADSMARAVIAHALDDSIRVQYFRFIRTRPDRAQIQEAWIFAALESPDAEETQSDGRIRRWRYIPEAARFLRVVLLADGETVHNAFFDRRFRL